MKQSLDLKIKNVFQKTFTNLPNTHQAFFDYLGKTRRDNLRLR